MQIFHLFHVNHYEYPQSIYRLHTGIFKTIYFHLLTLELFHEMLYIRQNSIETFFGKMLILLSAHVIPVSLKVQTTEALKQ